jgi:hypothetical protein
MPDEDDALELASQKVQGHKKPYVRPELKRLGSVRDLTLGTNVGCAMDGLKHIKVGM